MKTVNINSLSRVNAEYQNALRALPAYQLVEVCSALGINVLDVAGEDIIINKRRKGGVLRPYTPGLTPNQNQELIKFFESRLKPQLCYGSFEDNITNYIEKKVLSNNADELDLKTKKHPLEFEIIRDAILAINEDIIFQLFFAERDNAGTTPATAFNGIYTTMDALVTAGEISATIGNLVNTGEIAAPVDGDTSAYDRVVAFVKSAHPLLRAGECNLMISQGAITNVRDAFRNKVKSFDYPTTAQVLERLKDDAGAPGLKFVTHECLGNGSKLTLIKPNMIDLGFHVADDKDFIQVRSISKDPNEVQFWAELAIDTRIRDIHPKVFMTNEQTSTSIALAGDY